MYVGSLCEVISLDEASKTKKKKQNVYDKLISDNKKIHGGKSKGETIDRMSAGTGSTIGLLTGGVPGAVAGGTIGYFGSKAVRKANRWLDK